MSGECDLDPIIHAAARLRITAAMAGLAPGDGLTFNRLQALLDLTAGNLVTHLRKLEDAGYVAVDKTGAGRTAWTVATLTPEGRLAFERHTTALRALIDGT